jgi:tRNA pseudouridine synthase 10
MKGLLETAFAVLAKHPLCDYCLGRQFARLASGFSNRERGWALKLAMLMDALAAGDGERLKNLAVNGGWEAAGQEAERLYGVRLEKAPCTVCGGRLDEKLFRSVAEKIVKALAEYEFHTFLVGASVDASLREREDSIRSAFSLVYGEDFKNDVTREIGKIIAAATGSKVNHLTPDITIIVDIFRESFRIAPNPVFIGGRYLKHSRSLPQTVWHCRRCRGRGCGSCGYTGREYPTSVSEIVGGPAVTAFQAEGFKFHAAGREDVDAVVVGGGRPFVLELRKPRRRTLDLDKLAETINEKSGGLVTVVGLRYASRREMREMKLASPITVKSYSVDVEFERDVDAEKLSRVVEALRNAVIEQRTPMRVLRRRADRVRRKTVYEVYATVTGPRTVNFRVRCQGGVYVKELITGDGGRTKPSISEMLENRAVRIELAVVGVETPQQL